MLPLNYASLSDITGGDAELEGQLLSLYCATTERCLGRLQTLVHQDTEGHWHRVAHELKGASNNIRAEKMAALCKQIEHLPPDPEERAIACEHLAAAYAELKTAIGRV